MINSSTFPTQAAPVACFFISSCYPRYNFIMYYVYLLECADRSIYTGITTDVARRFAEHKRGKGGNYTRAHGARRILYSERRRTRGAALKREAEIKKWARAQKVALAGSTASGAHASTRAVSQHIPARSARRAPKSEGDP